MSNIKLLIKNSGALAVSHAISSLLGFFLLIYIARYLGEIDFGKYSFAVSVTALFSVIIGFGLNNLMIREISRNKNLTIDFIVNVSFVKLFMSGLGFIAFIIIINIIDYPPYMTKLLLLFIIYNILNSFAQTFRSVFQAHEQMEYEAFVSILDQSILFIIIILVLTSGYGLIEIGYAYILMGIINLILSAYIILRKNKKLEQNINFHKCGSLMVQSIPFGLNVLFAVLFFRVDSVMLSVLKGDAAVGIYNAAYTPLLSLGIIPTIITTALFPTMSRYFISSQNYVEILAIKSSKYIAVLGFPIAVGCLMLSDRFIELFYAEKFIDSAIPFSILALFIPIRWINIVNGVLLTSINQQKARTISVMLAALFNIIANMIMIPYLSYTGASIATVLSELFLFFAFTYYINNNFKNIKLYKYLIKPLLASLLMGAIILIFYNFNFLFLLTFSILVYFLTIFFIKTITFDEIAVLKKASIYFLDTKKIKEIFKDKGG